MEAADETERVTAEGVQGAEGVAKAEGVMGAEGVTAADAGRWKENRLEEEREVEIEQVSGMSSFQKSHAEDVEEEDGVHRKMVKVLAHNNVN